jgi:hypothetical protein
LAAAAAAAAVLLPANQHPIRTALESFATTKTTTSAKRNNRPITPPPTITQLIDTNTLSTLAKFLADKIIIPTATNNNNNNSSSPSDLAAMSMNDFPYQIAPWAKFSRKETPILCFPWFVNYDVWWTHHVTWRAASAFDNDTHYCFESIPSRKRVKLYRTLHDIQYGTMIISTSLSTTSTTTTTTKSVNSTRMEGSGGGDEPSTTSNNNNNKNNDHQKHPHCSRVFTQQMYSSGWGADMAHVVDAMEYALQHKVPMQVSMQEPWHYAGVVATKTKKKKMKKKMPPQEDKQLSPLSSVTSSSSTPRSPVCPQANMYCYFLNLTDCPPNHTNIFNGRGPGLDFWQEFHPNFQVATTQHLIDYVTRPQTWLRKAVYDFVQEHLITQLVVVAVVPPSPPPPQPLQQQQPPLQHPQSHPQQHQPQQCIVVHVRRSDVVLHNMHSRRYHELEEYMAAIPPPPQQPPPSEHLLDHDSAAAAAPPPYYYKQSILLLTDDATVIDEALTKYPQYHWIYIRRPRFKGPEGGFENHIPSADPKLELLVLLSLFHFIPRHCTGGVIHTMSNLGKYLAGILQHSPYRHDRDRYNTTIINLDAGLNTSDIFNANYSVVKG